MQRDEQKYLISFVNKSNELFNFDEEAKSKNYIWRLYSHLLESQLDNKLVTLTSLAASCGIPRATAIRKIKNLIKKKIIIQKPRTKTGKTYSLHLSEKTASSLKDYLSKTKEHIAHSLGYDSNNENSFFFGTSLLSANIISEPTVINLNCSANEEISILLNDNKTFKIIEENKKEIEGLIGVRLNLTLKNNDLLRKEIIDNHKRKKSVYEIICFDLPWVGEMHVNNFLIPLNELVSNDNLNIKDFHPEGIKGSSYDNQLYGLPIEQVASIMAYRKDILTKLDLKIPKKINELFLSLKKIKSNLPEIHPFAWPGKSGFTLGCFFIEMMSNLGSPLIRLRKISDSIYDISKLDLNIDNINISNHSGQESVYLISKLLKYSHPNVLSMSWDDVANSYAKGEVAIANLWSGRIGEYENDPRSPAYKNTIIRARPGGKDGYETSSIGGYSLGISKKINRKKLSLIYSVIRFLVSPAMIKYYIKKGVSTSPLFSVSNDPEVQKTNPSVSNIDKLQKTGRINSWSRLPVPQFSELANSAGNQIHKYLHNSKTHLSRQKCFQIVNEIKESFRNII